MHTVLILNPISGESALAATHDEPGTNEERILASLRAHNIEPTVLYTTVDDPGKTMAQQAALDGAELVIAAGGDGTLHAVASGVIGTKSALGILPMGTMNNIARSLKIPEDIEGACEIIATGETSQIDVGKINDTIFLEVAGAGLEAALFPAAEELKSKGMLSTFSGIAHGLRTLVSFTASNFTVTFDGKKRRHVKAIQISVCNSPYYGAHLQFAPSAMMDDGLLNVLIYRKFSKFNYFRHALSISQGRRDLSPRISRRKIKTLRIEAEHPVELHADGEPQGFTPATITVLPGVLKVRVPKKTAQGPNITTPERKKRVLYQKSTHAEQRQEKGPVNV